MPDHDQHEHADGCLCDLPHDQREAIEDHDLPAAVGGVEGERKPRRRKATRTAVEGDA